MVDYDTIRVKNHLSSDAEGRIWVGTYSRVYQYESGSWQYWSLSDFVPGEYVYMTDMQNINGHIYITASYNDDNWVRQNVLLTYNNDFQLITQQQVPVLQGLDYRNIIPGWGEAVHFITEFGFLEYEDGTWTVGEIDIDKDKLPGGITCMTKDSSGNIWLGTEAGVCKYDGHSFSNYCATSSRNYMFAIKDIVAGKAGKVYAVRPYDVDIIHGRQIDSIDWGDYRYDLDANLVVVSVSPSGRIWLGEDELYYHEGNGWVEVNGLRYVKSMTPHNHSGIWVGSWNQYVEFHLQHVTDDFTVTDYTAANSDLLPREKDKLYMDGNDVLWVKHNFSYGNTGYLQSFDGTSWVDYSTYNGFPALGVRDFALDESGKLYIVDNDRNILTLENDTFTLYKEQVPWTLSMALLGDKIYCAGGESIRISGYYTYPANFLEVGREAGVIEEKLWSRDYPLNLVGGVTTGMDLLSGINLSAGNYVLKNTLTSSLGQELAESSDPFLVRADGLSITLAGDRPTPYAKAGTAISLPVQIYNNTETDYSNLVYKIEKISPSEVSEILAEESLTLAPQGVYKQDISFFGSETGTWYLKAQVFLVTDGGEGPSYTSLGTTEIILHVGQHALDLETQAPEYAGDEPFAVKIKLTNPGTMETTVQINISSVDIGTSLLSESLTLAPGVERVLAFADTISADKHYKIQLSGDVEQEQTLTVKYGYVENLALDILPSYREGTVNLAYTLANSGGLAFTDTLHFELYTVGGVIPLYSLNKNYTLYPGEASITDHINFNLAPGHYLLKDSSSKTPLTEIPIVVNPSGIGTITLTGPATLPLGNNKIPFTLTNSDTVAGNIPIQITVAASVRSAAVLTESRNYELQPGESITDAISLNLEIAGAYTLMITGDKLSAPVHSPFQALALFETQRTLSIGTPQADRIPVTFTLANSGYSPFSGTLVIEVDGITSREPVYLASGESYSGVSGFSTLNLVPGTREVKAYLYDSGGTMLAQQAATVQMLGADIQVVSHSEDLVIAAGDFGTANLTLKNLGHLRGWALLKLSALDTLNRQVTIALEPGEGVEIENIYIDAAADLPGGSYPLYYTLTGTGVANGRSSGNVYFTVQGVSLDVDAAFDRSLYSTGETATLNIQVAPDTATTAILEAVVNWGDYSERKTFSLEGGSQQLTFEIPLEQAREEKVFYGIYHEGGKGIYLNDIYLHFREGLGVELDQQVYAPGDLVHALFSSETPGTLRASAFGETITQAISGTLSVQFPVPPDTLGGSYGVSWQFVSLDPEGQSLSGTRPFDVSGLVVKTAKAALERGKYAPGDTVSASFVFEANMDIGLALRTWVTQPSGDWQYLGEGSVALSAARHVDAVAAYGFSTGEAGSHHLVYGLYRGETLVLSGSLAFDVGDAVLMGLSTNQFEYKSGSENVMVKADYFGTGAAQLELFLDNRVIDTRSLSLDGVGALEITLTSDRVPGGSHGLRAVVTQAGLVSEKSTSFIYGSELPDLTLAMADSENEGLSYTYHIVIDNNGKSPSASTSLEFKDNEVVVSTVAIPGLLPGQSHEALFYWSGSGKAGNHEFSFVVDPANGVKEFSETNNSLAFSRDVPALFYTLEIQPQIWAANTEAAIITRLINNMDRVVTLNLDLSITGESTGLTIFSRQKVLDVTPFGARSITDMFNTGVFPAGQYTLGQGITGGNVDKREELYVTIEATRSVAVGLTLMPVRITAGLDTEVNLTLSLSNTGNVNLEDETLVLQVVDEAGDDAEVGKEIVFSLPIAGEQTLEETIILNLAPGNYRVRVLFLDEEMTVAPLQVVPALEKKKGVDARPRVLVMALNASQHNRAEAGRFAQLLSAANITHRGTLGMEPSYVQMHGNHHNVTVVLGNVKANHMLDELQERVFRGEGLILVCDTPMKDTGSMEFLGMSVAVIPGKKGETRVDMVDSPLGPAGTCELQNPIKLQLVPISDDVTLLAQTAVNKYPVMAYKQYGQGFVLVMCMSSDALAGGEYPAGIIANAAVSFSRDVFSASGLTRVLPMELALTNKGEEERSYKIKEILPYGVTGYGFVPEPEEGDDLQWQVKIPGQGTVRISYWLKLPDSIDDYEIKSEIYQQDDMIDEVAVNVSVEQQVSGCIAGLIADISALVVWGRDAQIVARAKDKLWEIQSRTGDTQSELRANLIDAVTVANLLARVTGINITRLRLESQNLMLALGRIFYEKTIPMNQNK